MPQKVKEYGKQHNGKYDFHKPFKLFDKRNTGDISIKNFTKVLDKLGVKEALSKSQLKVLVDLFDEDGDGRISYKEFVRFATGGGGSGGRRHGQSGSGASAGLPSAVARILESLRGDMPRSGLAKRKGKVSREFEEYDARGKERVSEKDFWRVLNSRRLDHLDVSSLSSASRRKLLRQYTASSSGKVKYMEFVRDVYEPEDSDVEDGSDDGGSSGRGGGYRGGSARVPVWKSRSRGGGMSGGGFGWAQELFQAVSAVAETPVDRQQLCTWVTKECSFVDAEGKLTLCAIEGGQFRRILKEVDLPLDAAFIDQLCIRLENDNGHIALEKFLSVVEFGTVHKPGEGRNGARAAGVGTVSESITGTHAASVMIRIKTSLKNAQQKGTPLYRLLEMVDMGAGSQTTGTVTKAELVQTFKLIGCDITVPELQAALLHLSVLCDDVGDISDPKNDSSDGSVQYKRFIEACSIISGPSSSSSAMSGTRGGYGGLGIDPGVGGRRVDPFLGGDYNSLNAAGGGGGASERDSLYLPLNGNRLMGDYFLAGAGGGGRDSLSAATLAFDRGGPGLGNGRSGSGIGGDFKGKLTYLQRKIRAQAAQLALRQARFSVRQVLGETDVAQLGKITARELQGGLQRMGLHLSALEMTQLSDMFKSNDGSGRVDYVQLCLWLSYDDEEVARLCGRVHDSLLRYAGAASLEKPFSLFDPLGEGSVGWRDFKHVLSSELKVNFSGGAISSTYFCAEYSY
jgi:Ca2+-binding EF-hand superfamily protein